MTDETSYRDVADRTIVHPDDLAEVCAAAADRADFLRKRKRLDKPSDKTADYAAADRIDRALARLRGQSTLPGDPDSWEETELKQIKIDDSLRRASKAAGTTKEGESL